MDSTTGGSYEVREDGLEFKHDVNHQPQQNLSGEEQIKRFKNAFQFNILEKTEDQMVFELKGCDTSFANALRRILIAEVPTMAIEKIYMYNNTSIIHDEVLSHRIGLIPLDVDSRLFDVYDNDDEDEGPTDRNTLVFSLKVKCGPKPDSSGSSTTSDGKALLTSSDITATERSVIQNSQLDEVAYAAAKKKAIETPDRPYTLHVYSSHLEWEPQGNQREYIGRDVRPVHDDILIAKLRPGQEIDLEAHAQVGIGRDHAKFSPVATASYRLYTNVELVEPVYDDDAEQLVHLYEPGVFELIPCDDHTHRVEAKVLNPYACTMSRNYMQNPTLAKAIKMTRVPDHFIFSVESVGMHSPAVLVASALRVLQKKTRDLSELLTNQDDAL